MSAKTATVLKPIEDAVQAEAPNPLPPAANAPRVKKPLNLNRLFGVLSMIGLGFVNPIVRIARGEPAQPQLRELWQPAGVPLLAIAIFLFAWSRVSATIETSLGHIPGPTAVWAQTQALWADHKAERGKAAAFHERQAKRNEARRQADPSRTRVRGSCVRFARSRRCTSRSSRRRTAAVPARPSASGARTSQ